MIIDDFRTQTWAKRWEAPAAGTPEAIWRPQVEAQWPGLRESLAATPQDPIYHAEGDVWVHTVAVVNALLNHPAYAALNQAEQGVVYHAAVLHDIAKPPTTREINGRLGAPGHSRRGAIEARIQGWKHGWSFGLREAVSRLIEAHQWPFHAFDDRQGRSPEFIVRHAACDRPLDLLCLLATADLLGRESVMRQEALDQVALFEEQARELECWKQSYPFPDAATRIAYLRAQGSRFADDPVHQDRPFEVILLSGLPASGKSTWADNQDLPVIGYDNLREELDLKAGEGIGTVMHAATDRMREHLRARESFVVNATHLSQQMRQRTLDLVRDYGGTARVHYFETDPSTLLSRHANRDSTLPEAQLLRMAHRWEVPGLTEVEHVTLHVSVKPSTRHRLST
jgi:predicted kinase